MEIKNLDVRAPPIELIALGLHKSPSSSLNNIFSCRLKIWQKVQKGGDLYYYETSLEFLI